MNTLTYKEAYDKIIEAYFKDKIIPLDPDFCFCGTLCGNRDSWQSQLSFRKHWHSYTWGEYGRMEAALFSSFPEITWKQNGDLEYDLYWEITEDPEFENKLFTGMSAALDVLKEIHRSRGENVDEDIPAFTKRELAKTDIEVVVNN